MVQLIDRNPSDSNVRMGLANALLYGVIIDEALSNIEYAMEINPHHDDWFHWVHAWALRENGEFEAALIAI